MSSRRASARGCSPRRLRPRPRPRPRKSGSSRILSWEVLGYRSSIISSLAPTLCVGSALLRRSASQRTTRSVRTSVERTPSPPPLSEGEREFLSQSRFGHALAFADAAGDKHDHGHHQREDRRQQHGPELVPELHAVDLQRQLGLDLVDLAFFFVAKLSSLASRCCSRSCCIMPTWIGIC